MSMARALINTDTQNRHLTESAPKAIVLAITFFFDGDLGGIAFGWVHITPSRFTPICSENILISYCPISQTWSTRFRRWTKIFAMSYEL